MRSFAFNLARWWAFLFLVLLLLAVSRANAGISKQWHFNVYLDDKPIGYHKISLSENAGQKFVKVDASFEVKLLFFLAYRYEHNAEELWTGSCLEQIHTSTNDNGDSQYIRSIPDRSGLSLLTHKGKQSLDGCIRSFAYWDPSLLQSEYLLNTQSGEYQAAKLIKLGKSRFIFKDREFEADQYRLEVEDQSIDLWYTSDRDWLALQTRVRGDRVLSYLREDVVEK